MASVFLSYDHEDANRASPIAAALETHGHSVWWDRHLHGGAEYNSEIEAAVEQADAVVVLWSTRSVRSAWVRDEAGEGRDRGRLVPVLIEPVKPPMGFRQYQTLDLSGWTGGKRIPRIAELLHAIERVAGPASTSQIPVSPPQPIPPAAKRRGADGQRMSRRLILGSGAAVALAGGAGLWWSTRSREDPRFTAIIDQAEDQIRHFSADQNTVRSLERAVAMRPDSSKAWGLLALLRSSFAQDANPTDAMRVVEQAEQTASRALSLDPKEPNALLAMFELQGSSLDWYTRDQKLRQIIGIDPKNVTAIGELVLLTQATGMCRESWALNERAITLEPLSAEYLGRRALKLWILGRTAEADKVSDQVRSLYPAEWWPWFVRMQIYAFTGRAQAALAMVDTEPGGRGHSPMAALWRATLPAMDRPSPHSVANARQICISASENSAQLSSQGVMIMATLHDLDTAFAIAEGALLSRGSIVPKENAATSAAQNAGWRISTQWMFTPAAAPMRPDPRFLPLCNGIGLTDYWRRRGVRPDYQRA